MASTMGHHAADWKVVATRIPPSEHRKLIQRYPEKGKVSKVVRALIQMHLAGKIKDLHFTITDIIT